MIQFNRTRAFAGLLLLLLILSSGTPLAEHLLKQSHKGYGGEPSIGNYEWIATITLPALAVASSGGGVISNLTMSIAYPGSGELYFNAEPLTMIDSQASARIAFRVAAEMLGIDYSSYDAFVSLKSPSMIVGGPSAGAVMTVGFLSLLGGYRVNSSVAMTGMIYPDGTIGPVGGIKEKMEAAAREGFKLFLVPAGESIVFVEKTERRGGVIYVTREPLNLTDYGKELGIKVVEVASIDEAASYFLVGWKSENTYGDGPSYSEEAASLFEKWIRYLNSSRLELYRLSNSSTTSGFLNHSIALASQALEYISEGKYYIAASYMFSATALAEAAYVKTSLRTPNDLFEYLQDVNQTIMHVEEIVKWTIPTNVSSLEAVITAKQRIEDAKNLLNQALEGVYSVYDPITGETRIVVEDASAMSLAYAKWRALIALKWLEYSRIQSPEIDRTDLDRVAVDFMGLASTVVSYYTSLMEDLGLTASSSPSMTYQQGVEALASGDPITAITLFLQSLADSMTGLHRVFDYKPGDIAAKLETMLYKKLARPGYSSVIALGYMEYGQESLRRYYETGDSEDAFAAIRLFTLSSLQDVLTRYIVYRMASDNRPHPVLVGTVSTVTVTTTSTVTASVTSTVTKEATKPQVGGEGTSPQAVTRTVTLTLTVTEGVSERSFMASIALVAVLATIAVLLAVFRRG